MAGNPKEDRRADGTPLEGGTSPDKPTALAPRQDTFHKVLFGQISDPIFPSHPEAPEVTDAELAKQFEEDSSPSRQDATRLSSPYGRVLVLWIVVGIALGIVFFSSRV